MLTSNSGKRPGIIRDVWLKKAQESNRIVQMDNNDYRYGRLDYPRSMDGTERLCLLRGLNQQLIYM
ncbi:hypothetical protein [Paenibacillus illinoisensis]|uniref:hypothetical protein n=1 Tax=Paenibacillus illinoisensis TaxID=59845 RepID=UPI00301D8FC5